MLTTLEKTVRLFAAESLQSGGGGAGGGGGTKTNPNLRGSSAQWSNDTFPDRHSNLLVNFL